MNPQFDHRVALVDFNSFFASVEQQLDPTLRGRPVAVVPVQAETTSCIAASIEAKRRGVRTGTPVWKARQLCPDIVFVHAEHSKYVEMHHRALIVIDSVLPLRQVLSIDEVSCDLIGRWAEPERICSKVRELKTALAEQLGECLRVSVGVGPNTLMAKLASDLEKPDGFVMLDDACIPSRFIDKPIRSLNGIGHNMEARLNRAGICSMADLYAAPRSLLRIVWGSVAGEEMFDRLHGLPESGHAALSEARSLGHSHVLPPDMRNPKDALAVLDRLTQKAAMRLRKQRFYASQMSVHAHELPGQQYPHPSAHRRHSVSTTACFAQTQETTQLLQHMRRLWMQAPCCVAHPLHVGLVLHGLVPMAQHTPDLFEVAARQAISASTIGQINPIPQKLRGALESAIDSINKKNGKTLVYFAGAHGALEHAPMRIAFNRIPDLETER